MALKWQDHGGNPTGVVVERRLEVSKTKSTARGARSQACRRARLNTVTRRPGTDNILRIEYEP